MQTKVDAPAPQSQQLRDAPKQTELAVNESEQLFEDSRPVVSQAKAAQAMMVNSPAQTAMQTMQAKIADSMRVQNQLGMQKNIAEPATAQLKIAQNNTVPIAQLVAGEESAQLQQTSKPNNTGLPNQLKSGIESLSGMSMDHVKVHYNSSQPAQLNAHAYAQGSEIHVAPGQEQHLPHEAWHVVQQAQGRVKPTMQMKAGVPVNDDAGLEAEADVMGAKAMAAGSQQPVQAASILSATTSSQSAPAQRYAQVGDTAVSENARFAVKNDGKPNSELYMANPGELPALENVEQEIGGAVTIANTEMVRVKMQSEKNRGKNEGGALHCGPFARNIMPGGASGNDKDAAVGNHLHMSSVEVPGTPWSNHFAAVIAQDGGDRATFETAVGLKHMYFGIYGAEGVQTFRHKTMVAGIMLGIETNNSALLNDLIERNEIEKKKGFIGYDKEIALMKGDIGNAKAALVKIQSARELQNEEAEIIALKEALAAREEAYREMEEEREARDAARDERHRIEDDERERVRIAKEEKSSRRKKILWALAVLAVSVLIIALI